MISSSAKILFTVGTLCEKDLKNLEKWDLEPEVKIENAQILTEQGRRDLASLAVRLKNTFPELLSVNDTQNIKDGDYVVSTTNFSGGVVYDPRQY